MYLNSLNSFFAMPIFFILAGIVAIIGIVFAVRAILKASRKGKPSKAELRAEEKAKKAAIKAQEDKELATFERAVAARKDREHQEACRKEVAEKLAAQAAEAGVTEEPVEEKKAPAKKATKKAEKKEEPAKEELAVAEEPVKEEKKAPAKKVAAKKEEPVKEEPAKEEKKAPAKKVATKKEEPVKAVAPVKEEKKAPAKKAPAKKEDLSEEEQLARYAGKWIIYHILTENNSEDDMYFFELHASNGEKLLSSEEYTSYEGAVKGIQTHKTNILKDNFKITLSKKGDYIFKLLSGNGQLLCMGENYKTKTRCESAIQSAKRFAKTAIVEEKAQDFMLKIPVDDDNSVVEPVAEGVVGKWIINHREDSTGEEVFYFELFANNGEKLLSSEEYTTYEGAVKGIQTHKQNIEKGNFRISLTKKGDYIYKVLNGNGQLLCLGEHYKSKTRCQQAVESVKRFASSPVLTDAETAK